MAVDVELFGQLLPGEERRRALETAGPVLARDIAKMIGLDLEEVGFIAIDGQQGDLDTQVAPHSRICFFPYITGG